MRLHGFSPNLVVKIASKWQVVFFGSKSKKFSKGASMEFTVIVITGVVLFEQKIDANQNMP